MRADNGAYKLLTTLLYGSGPWLVAQHGGMLTVRTGPACLVLGWQRTKTLRSAAQTLVDMDILTDFQWHGHFFLARLRPPTAKD